MDNKETLKKDIGLRIREIRVNKMHMSKSEFASLIEMKNQYLGMLENGQRGLTIEKAIDICNKTGVTCDYLLRGMESSIKEVAQKMLSKYSNENIYTAFEILKDFALLLK